jgi:hypothetical protein
MNLRIALKFVGFTIFVSSLSASIAMSSKAQSSGTSSGTSARGLFFEQIKKPEAKLNTGVIYWVELDRAGQKSHVTNKTTFVEGDKIRFHFKPNIDGYAYILIAEGSNGEKTTLFPSGELSDNKVKCGEEIVLPFAKGTDQAWLKFDDTPGTETVRIIVSRTPIDVKDEGKESKKVEPDLKVSSSSTHADKIPDGTFISMDEPSGSTEGSRGLIRDVRHAPAEIGEIAVVNADPKKELSIDIALEHKKKDH